MSYKICLSLTYFTWYDNLSVHPCYCKWHYFVLFYSWVIVCVYMYLQEYFWLPWWLSSKESCQCRRYRSNRWVGNIPWGRKWQPTTVLLPGKSHGQRSLWVTVPGVAKSQTRLEWLSAHTGVLYIFWRGVLCQVHIPQWFFNIVSFTQNILASLL